MNCWEFTHCGHEPCGAHVKRDGLCPASLADQSKNKCWTIMQTLCHGGVQSDFKDKLKVCLTCPFFTHLVAADSANRRLVSNIFAETPAAPQTPPPPPARPAAQPQPDRHSRR